MRIWFNRGYSLAAITKAMLAGNPALEAIISIGQGYPVRPGPSQTWYEPAGDAAAYADWVREQIELNGIELLVPTRHRALLAEAELPCRLHLPTSLAKLEIIDDKLAFAMALAGQSYALETQGIATADELRAQIGLRAHQNPGEVLCVKPRRGVNGHGFWRLTQGSPSAHLMDPEARAMRADLYLQAIDAAEAAGTLQPLVLMAFLPGPEVSFDVLAHHGRVLKYVARTKQDSRQRLQSRHPLEEIARELVDRFDLHGLVNIQFRKAQDGTWKVLEINARPAGGSVYSEPFGSRLIADWGGLLAGTLTPEAITCPDIDVEIELVSTVTEVGKVGGA